MLYMKFQANDDPAENINFDVKLGKSTDFEPITWHFPDTNQCPLKQCMLSRSDRNEAFNHFCMDHADITMLCLFCNELILAVNSDDLRRHHEDKHPNEVQPKLKTVSHILSILSDYKKDLTLNLFQFFNRIRVEYQLNWMKTHQHQIFIVGTVERPTQISNAQNVYAIIIKIVWKIESASIVFVLNAQKKTISSKLHFENSNKLIKM